MEKEYVRFKEPELAGKVYKKIPSLGCDGCAFQKGNCPENISCLADGIIYLEDSDETKKRVYISGAIAHHDLNERMTTFNRAAIMLADMGFIPVNPFDNGVDQSEHWTKHMRADIALLCTCDMIYMLKGWELSKGAKLEHDVATSCGIKVLKYEQ